MARKNTEETGTPDVEEQAVPVASIEEVPPAEVPEKAKRSGSGRGRIKVTHTETGKTFIRNDVILALWETRQYDRNQIVQVLSRDYGHETSYQTVFSTTKDVEGGPVKPEKPAEDETPAETEG